MRVLLWFSDVIRDLALGAHTTHMESILKEATCFLDSNPHQMLYF